MIYNFKNDTLFFNRSLALLPNFGKPHVSSILILCQFPILFRIQVETLTNTYYLQMAHSFHCYQGLTDLDHF